MYRIDHATAAAVRPSDAGAGTQGFWTEGSPGVTPATVLAYDWFNMLQEELRAVVIDGALTPTKGSETQVRDAIRAMITNVAGFPGMIGGLEISNNAGDAANDIDFAAGLALSADATTFLRGAAMTKRIDATWVAGSGNGGRGPASLNASTWYHCFVVNKTDGGVDFGFDTDPVAAALLARTGGTKYRCIGSVLTNGSSQIIAFKQRGNWFLWNVTPRDHADTSPGTSRKAYALSVPPDFRVQARVRMYISGSAGNFIVVVSENESDVAPAETTAPLSSAAILTQNQALTLDVFTNTAKEIFLRSTQSNAGIYIVTIGYEHSRGRWV